MAFFFNDADQQDDPDDRDDREIVARKHQRQQRATPAEGRVDRIVMGWMKLS